MRCPLHNAVISESSCLARQRATREERSYSRGISPFDDKCIGCLVGYTVKAWDTIKNEVTWEMETKPETKQCKACGKELPLEEFHRHPTKKYGRETICKQCRSKDAKRRNQQRKMTDMAIETASKHRKLKPSEIIIDFSEHPAVLDALVTSAKIEIRNPEAQALYIIRKALCQGIYTHTDSNVSSVDA
jgi:Zn finger protein HypA/HybF involved in hydrogenase expression